VTNIDAKQAAQALNDIENIVQRVRQSRIYDIASQILIATGVVVLAGNVANFAVPRYPGPIWITVNVLSIAIAAALITMSARRIGEETYNIRIAAAYLLFYGFGLLNTSVFGHFGPRELGAFWPIYFMLFYCIAGLWFGRAFIAMGLSIIALTLIGYFFVEGAAFLLWMAAFNGGGLIVSGLWMRRI
jgi:hypothetical protein